MVTGTEPVLAPVIKAGSSEAAKWVRKTLSEWLKSSKEANQRKDLAKKLTAAIEKSAVTGYERFSYVVSLAFSKQHRLLNDVYVPLTLVLSVQNKKYKIDEFPDKLFRESNTKVLVVDTAGTGKSTIARRIYTKALEEEKVIPILVDLRRLRGTRDIYAVICEDLEIDPAGKGTIKEIFAVQPFLFILDGFDEIPELRKPEAVTILRAFIDNASAGCFLLTSRPESGLAGFSDFRRYSLAPLETEEAYKLLAKYDSGKDISKTLVAKLKSREGDAVRSFLKNPLLTTLLFRAFEYKTTIPLKKNVFYRQVFDALFESHDLSKEPGYTRQKVTRLHIDDLHRVLRGLAAVFHNHGTTETTKDEFCEFVKQASKYWQDLSVKPSDLLKDLLGPVPLFLEDGVYVRWAHKALLDYFLSEFFVRDFAGDKGQTLANIITDKNVARFENFVDILYEIDPVLVKNHLILPVLRQLLSRAEVIRSKFAADTPPQLVDVLAGFLSCFEIVFIVDEKYNNDLFEFAGEKFDQLVHKIAADANVNLAEYEMEFVSVNYAKVNWGFLILSYAPLKAFRLISAFIQEAVVQRTPHGEDLEDITKVVTTPLLAVQASGWLYGYSDNFSQKLGILSMASVGRHDNRSEIPVISKVSQTIEKIEATVINTLQSRQSFQL